MPIPLAVGIRSEGGFVLPKVVNAGKAGAVAVRSTRVPYPQLLRFCLRQRELLHRIEKLAGHWRVGRGSPLNREVTDGAVHARDGAGPE
jgi:hypothetical protein